MSLNTTTLDSRVASSAPVVGDAVGVSDPHWYVAVVNHNTEKNTADTLSKLGYDTYVATQQEYRIWRNGRRAKIDRVVIPSTVFVRCTEAERLRIARLPQVFRFLTNRAARQGDTVAPPAIIPEVQLRKLRFMLGQSDIPVGFATRPMAPGDKVRVIRGSLRGLEGEVLASGPAPLGASGGRPSGPATSASVPKSATAASATAELLVRLDILGCARVAISPLDLEPLPS